MQAIILAAGKGTRLKPLTDEIPKPLTEVNGKPMLLNALDILDNLGISETIIVVGYKREKIIEAVGFYHNNMKITYVENPIYDTTNNIYSLYLAKQYVREDVLLLECDLFYKQSIVEQIMKAEAQCNIMVSDYNAAIMDGTVITTDADGKIRNLVVKKYQDNNFDYTGTQKTVNIYKMSKEFAVHKMFSLIKTYVETQSLNSYYELILGTLINWNPDDFALVSVDESEWAEVDNVDDLKRAEALF